jgi:superfamily II DNA/RNA helicase
MPRALVLEPTRELADQVSGFDRYSKYSKLSHALIGGVSMDDQVKKLIAAWMLIATLGRLMDHRRGRILLSQVNILRSTKPTAC